MGSKKNSAKLMDESAKKYLYINLAVKHIVDSSIETIKDEILYFNEEYDGIDTFCSERWGMFDLGPWLEELGIEYEILFPTPAKQKEAFSELLISIRDERFKTAPMAYHGTRQKDIFMEEFSMLETTPGKDWYGSPEKNKTDGGLS